MIHLEKIPSNKSFGLVFALVFMIVAIFPLLNYREINLWSLIISLIFFILGILNSKFLTPLNKIWMKFGLILGGIMAPILMSLIFFLVVTPTGLILKLFKKDVLMLKKNNLTSYWLKKDNSNNNLKNQF
tara:strand:- start:47 stop:433 length:387 start_codon:yes stop_codon:yes gene_type:complete